MKLTGQEQQHLAFEVVRDAVEGLFDTETLTYTELSEPLELDEDDINATHERVVEIAKDLTQFVNDLAEA